MSVNRGIFVERRDFNEDFQRAGHSPAEWASADRVPGIDGGAAMTVRDAGGSGASLNVALVMTARLPNEPHISLERS